jgi:predicted RNase H-like HicB family nuclease
MRKIKVTYHREGKSWWAEAGELEGFTAVANSFAELRQLVCEGIAFYLNDAPHELDEKLDSGATLVGIHSPVPGFTQTSWSSELATAWSRPRNSVEVGRVRQA